MSDGETKFDKPKDAPWLVRGGQFRFRIESKFPISKSVVGSDLENGPKRDMVAGRAPIFARLTQKKSPFTSTLKAKITGPKGHQGADWQVIPIDKNLPKGMWDQCKSWANLPSSTSTTWQHH